MSAAFAAVPAFAADSIPVSNPSFQAQDFPDFPGYIGGGNSSAITGWTGVGGVGINGLDIGAGTPFADNGLFPDNSRAAFIQDTGSLSQNLSGFNAPPPARTCCSRSRISAPVATERCLWTMCASSPCPSLPPRWRYLAESPC